MTDETPKVPPLLHTLVHDYSQKLLTALSVWAMTHGAEQFIGQVSAVNGETSTMFLSSAIQVGVGVALFILSCAWTYGIAYLRKEKMTSLLEFVPGDK